MSARSASVGEAWIVDTGPVNAGGGSLEASLLCYPPGPNCAVNVPGLPLPLGTSLGAESVVAWVWWTAQWPVLLAVLLASFAAVFALADVGGNRRWRLVTPGAAVAVVGWLASVVFRRD